MFSYLTKQVILRLRSQTLSPQDFLYEVGETGPLPPYVLHIPGHMWDIAGHMWDIPGHIN